jgi:hypothetical protein
MAKIVTESIVITFSKIVKDTEQGASITSPEIETALEQVAQELIGNSFIESSAIKIGYLYYCMLNKRSTGLLSPLIPAIAKDFGRICAMCDVHGGLFPARNPP